MGDRRTAVVTGATSGIGLATARALARRGDRVVVAARTRARGERAVAEIRSRDARADVDFVTVDFSSVESVRACGRELDSRLHRIDVLVNNAGTWSSSRRLSADGFELTWATNQLGYFLLTEALRPALTRSAPARVVVVASELAYGLDLDDVNFERRPYDGVAAYAQSKQANRMWTRELSRRLQGSGVTANSMHPGGVRTPLFSKGGGWKGVVAGWYGRWIGRSPEEGADTVVWLASDPSVASRSGGFFVDRAERACRFDDPSREGRLWDLCASMTARGEAASPA